MVASLNLEDGSHLSLQHRKLKEPKLHQILLQVHRGLNLKLTFPNHNQLHNLTSHRMTTTLSLTPTADTTRTQPPTMTMGAPYRPPAFPPHSAARPQVATQPANLRYRPPPVRGVIRQPLPTASPTSAANPLGTNMTFMPTP
ncbi:RNA binding protein fox-1-like 2 [Sesbania bispinosa]|nr:RNA binding protein fox-1-like 2 [Sesbania bispinosa]